MTAYRKIQKILSYIAAGIFAAMALYFMLLAGFSTTHIMNDTSEKSMLVADSVWVNAAITLVFGALCFLLCTRVPFFKRFISKMNEEPAYAKKVRLVLICVYFLMCLVFVLCARQGADADQGEVCTAATEWHWQEYNSLEEGGYIFKYPNQMGIITLFYGLFGIVGNTNYTAIQILNALLLVITVWKIGRIADACGKGGATGFFWMLGFVLFIPLMMYTTFVYGTIAGLCCSVCAVEQGIKGIDPLRRGRSFDAACGLAQDDSNGGRDDNEDGLRLSRDSSTSVGMTKERDEERLRRSKGSLDYARDDNKGGRNDNEDGLRLSRDSSTSVGMTENKAAGMTEERDEERLRRSKGSLDCARDDSNDARDDNKKTLRTIYHFILCAVFALLAIWCKQNYMILIIGLGITALIWWKAKWWKGLCLFLAMALVLLGSMPLIGAVARGITGQEMPKGIAQIAWVEMGLQENPSLYDGWWNTYNVRTFEEAENDREEQEKRVRKDLDETLERFRQDPGYAYSFFAGKNASQWNNPDFQSWWINQAYSSLGSQPMWMKQLLTPNTQDGFGTILNYGQFIALFGCLLYVFFRKEKDFFCLWSMVCYIGGVLFHSVWEAKAQYTLVYFVLLIPVAVSGFGAVFRRLNIVLQEKKNKIKAARGLLGFACAMLLLFGIVQLSCSGTKVQVLGVNNEHTEMYREYLQAHVNDALDDDY